MDGAIHCDAAGNDIRRRNAQDTPYKYVRCLMRARVVAIRALNA
jgi:hypothetical protein